jgi:hypothetical protein
MDAASLVGSEAITEGTPVANQHPKMAFGTGSGVTLKCQAGSVGLQNAGLNMLGDARKPLKN